MVYQQLEHFYIMEKISDNETPDPHTNYSAYKKTVDKKEKLKSHDLLIVI